MNKRKIQIGLITFLLMVAAYIVYSIVSGSSNIVITENSDTDNKIELPDFDTEAGTLGTDFKIAPVKQSNFQYYDKETKGLKRVFGFEKLLNPESGTDFWRLQNPYMKIYEDKFRCNIKSDKGNVRVETVNNQVNPVSAELSGNVEILIQTRDDGRQMKIELENLTYDNERSEFATDGLVRLVSDDGIMQGEGLILVYNAEVGKLAYLEITKLNYFLLKNVQSPESTVQSAGANRAVESNSIVAVVTDDPPEEGPAAELFGESDGTDGYKYYQCSLDKNVKIEYGRKIVVVGADDVVISNILWSGEASKDGAEEVNEKTAETVAASEEEASGSEEIVLLEEDIEDNIDQRPLAAAVASGTIGENDIFVQCEGSLIIRPMEFAGLKPERLEEDNRRTMEIKGKPIKVGQPMDDNSEGIATIASCGLMTYDIDSEVLDLERGELEPYIELSMKDKQASIITEGSVKWKRKDNEAIIVGPGKLLIADDNQQRKSPNMKFDGILNVYFADKSEGVSQAQLMLSNVDLAGGMVVNLNDEDNTVVHSETANLHFTNGSQITAADLGGGVNMLTDRGSVNSENAQILFAMSETGQSEPVRVTSVGNATLEPTDIESSLPTRFHAKKIEYDIATGKAVAHGPVKFIFYPPMKTSSEQTGEPSPIVITADENAEYFPEKYQVVFNDNVLGSRTSLQADMVQHETLKGDQLIVDLMKGEGVEGQDQIKHVRVAGDIVELRSQRTVDDYELFDTSMTCQQLDWGAFDNTIIAKGPGEIQIDNKNTPESEVESDDRYDLDGPCQAMISGFSSLAWDIDNGIVRADGGDASVNIGYLPIKDGEQGQVVRAAAGNIACKLEDNAEGRFDLVWIKTYDGILYEEVGKHSIMGDNMEYTAQTGIMAVKGRENEPCLIDGSAKAAYVEYDTKTGRISSQLSR